MSTAQSPPHEHHEISILLRKINHTSKWYVDHSSMPTLTTSITNSLKTSLREN